jgi:hypothetical protein
VNLFVNREPGFGDTIKQLTDQTGSANLVSTLGLEQRIHVADPSADILAGFASEQFGVELQMAVISMGAITATFSWLGQTRDVPRRGCHRR